MNRFSFNRVLFIYKLSKIECQSTHKANGFIYYMLAFWGDTTGESDSDVTLRFILSFSMTKVAGIISRVALIFSWVFLTKVKGI